MDVPSPSLLRAAARRARTFGAPLLVAGLLLATVAPATAAGSTKKPAAVDPNAPVDPEKAAAALEATLSAAPDAPPASDDPFYAVASATKSVTDTALVLWNATESAQEAQAKAFKAKAVQDRATAAKNRAVAERDAARTDLDTERARLRDLTVAAFVTGGDAASEETRALLNGDTTDPAGGRRLMFGQVLDRQQHVVRKAEHRLSVARRELAAARRRLADATRMANAAARVATDRTRTLFLAKQANDRAKAQVLIAQKNLRDRVRSGSAGVVPSSTPLIGIPRLTAADLAGWFAFGSYRPRVATPIADYAKWFIEEGAAEGIRGDIAFAQAVLETGGFTNTDSVVANNFSGIGHCDTCPSGWRFPSPQMGVRAQIQLLKSYAVKKPQYVHPLVDSRLHGPAGCCPTWDDLTTVWATDPTYGPKVMLLYTDMVNFALARRAAGQGFDPVT